MTTPEATPTGTATATQRPLQLTVVPRVTIVVPTEAATATAWPTEEPVTPIVPPTCPIPTQVAPPSAEPTVTAVATIAPAATAPASLAYACPGLEKFVDMVFIEAALAHPDGVGGWNVRCNPNVPDSPVNGRRHSLTLVKPRTSYHPMSNPLQYQCGCP
ncbi:MAG: hypothetical protein IT332_15145 [Ardenticatenales bacterium]|nr:hypothetical protein [Ardenticatenales bacterium]